MARSNVGKVRARNEDGFLVGDTYAAESADVRFARDISLARPVLLAVADGIGGHAAGGRASAAVLESLASRTFADRLDVEAALREVDEALLVRGQTIDEYRLGTTFCAFLLGSRSAAIVVGDGYLACRSSHGVRTFGPSWEDVAVTMRIASAIGGREPEEALVLDWHDAVAEPGMRFLIASDGLIRAMPESVCVAALAVSTSPEECIARLFTEARMGLMPDNMTCIIADVYRAAVSR